MERRRKPTVINLREHLHDATKATATFLRHAGTEAESSSYPPQLPENSPTPESLFMTAELDEELSNDFKWLIDFDLHSVFLHDIEDDNSEFDRYKVANGWIHNDERFLAGLDGSYLKKNGKALKTNKQDTAQNFKPKKYVPFTYTEMILQCLDDVGEVSVKNIYKWISNTFPDFKSSDISWKNAIRHTLTVNSLFQKKKSDLGRYHVWYLDRTAIRNAKKTRFQSVHLENPTNAEHQKPGKLKQNRNKSKSPQKKIFLVNAGNTNLTPSYPISTNSTENYQQKYNSENWLVTESGIPDYRNINLTEVLPIVKNGSEDYYSQEIAIIEFPVDSANYTEPMEVKSLLDENAASIPVQIIEEKTF
ncbi:fork-head domain-containing protein [Caerostris darwini]|uniref:Fork-head domain-containing protein n=1 Tax=Caerostris darwini TaxID=1538125 RepID=A0AAV4TJK2_9ARAC|nr:fork-head domain-containing protein [Caerostris darwini]